MNYTITYENRADYIYVVIEGLECYKSAVEFWKNIKKKSDEEGRTKFLIVDRVSGQLKTIETHRLSVIVAELISGMKVAFVDPKDETFDSNAFGETVIANRGGGAKLFRTEREGLKWLLS